MKSLLNQRVELIALPPKSFTEQDTVDLTATCSIVHRASLTHAPAAQLSSEIRDANYLKRSTNQIEASSDVTRALAIYVALDRKVIAAYLDRARSFITERLPTAPMDNGAKPSSSLRELKGTVFNGELVRDLHAVAYAVLVACHIADPKRFAVNQVVSVSPSSTYCHKFQMDVGPARNSEHGINLKTLDPHLVFKFLSSRKSEFGAIPSSQFMRSLSYLSQSFRFSRNPLTVLIWSLSSIEALLSISGERANSGILLSRIRALIGDELDGDLVGDFRELYRYRNALLHGNVAIPFSFDDKNALGIAGIKHSETMPFEKARFTYSLAIRLLQRFIELDAYSMNFVVHAEPG
jgi:hypothetical protein